MADDGFSPPRNGHFEMSSDEPGRTRAEIRGSRDYEVTYDEGPPQGLGEYPPPVHQMFGSLVACQMAVLSKCLHKARIEDYEISADAIVDRRERESIPEEMPENTAKRIRHIDIDIDLTVPEDYEDRGRRCLDVYDQGCIVGQSFRAGIQYTPKTTLTTK